MNTALPWIVLFLIGYCLLQIGKLQRRKEQRGPGLNNRISLIVTRFVKRTDTLDHRIRNLELSLRETKRLVKKYGYANSKF